MPKLSVIVPVYGVEAYLPRCVESILQQTYTDLELILVDDGSPDRCGAMVDEYARMDSRVVAVHQENQGPGGARTGGLRVAKGGYIGFVDPDDWVEPDMYETLIRAITETGSDIASCSWVENYEDGTEKVWNSGLTMQVMSGQEFREHLFDMPSGVGNMVFLKLYKKELIHTYFDNVIYEDHLFNAQYCCNISKAAYINRPLYHYFARLDSATKKEPAKVLAYALPTRRQIIKVMGTVDEKCAMLAEKVFINWGVILCGKMCKPGSPYYEFAKNEYLTYFAQHPHVLLKNKTFPWKQKLYFYAYYLKLKYEKDTK